MNPRFESHLFWGFHSPLSALTCTALVIMASSRLAFALVSTGALVWVYGLSALIFSGARSIMPVRGKMLILLFLSSFLCGVFILLVGLLNPLLILGTGFFLILVPPCCLGSGFFEACGSEYPGEVFSRALLESVVMAGLIIALALIREPLGMGSLSFPGGVQGIVEIFASQEEGGFLPIRLLSASAGGLLLLGYGTALFRYFRERSSSIPLEEAEKAGSSGHAFPGEYQ